MLPPFADLTRFKLVKSTEEYMIILLCVPKARLAHDWTITTRAFISDSTLYNVSRTVHN